MAVSGKALRETHEDPHVSISQTARELGVARATVLGLIVKRDLHSERSAGRTVVTRQSLDDHKARIAAGSAESAESAASAEGAGETG